MTPRKIVVLAGIGCVLSLAGGILALLLWKGTIAVSKPSIAVAESKLMPTLDGNAQPKALLPPDQPELIGRLESSAHRFCQHWSRGVTGYPDYPILSRDQSLEAVGRWLALNKGNSVAYYHERFSKAETTLLESIRCNGGKEGGILIQSEPPFLYVKKGGQMTAILWGYGLPSIYHADQTSIKGRATSAAFQWVLPHIRYLVNAYEGTEVVNVGLAVAYGSCDFTKDATHVDGEAILLVGSLKHCGRFAAKEITDQEFLDGCDIYMSGESADSLMKVTIQAK